MTTASTAADQHKYADVSDPNGEPVAVWERVSTDLTRQEIMAQTRDIRAYLKAGSYRVARVFSIEASAYHGKHDPELQAALADVAGGRYTAVIAAMSSRFERRGWKALMRYMLELDEAGGRLVAVDDPKFGDVSTVTGAFGTVMDGDRNHSYSEQISHNVNRANRLRDENNVFRGSIPSGYTAVGPDGAKQLEPRPVASEAVVEAFIDAANRKSTTAIARTFKALCEREGLYQDKPVKDENGDYTGKTRRRYALPVTWQGVQKCLHNPLYSTGRYLVTRHDGSVYTYHGPALVSPAQQRAAITSLQARHTGDNITSRAIAKDDYSGVLRCDACGEHGRMYRYYASKRRRYRCESCHATVHGPNTDEALHEKMSAYTAPWYLHRTEDLNAERDRRIANIDAELDTLNRTARDNAWTRQHKRDVEDALFEQRDKLSAMPDREPVSHVDVHMDGDRALSEGDHWLTMTTAERRDLLTGGSVMVYVKATADRSGNVLVDVEREE